MTLNQQNRDELEAAIDMVARQVIASLVEENIGFEWENFPEIGEQDWLRVQARCLELVPLLDFDTFGRAYALLESRAEQC